MSNDFEFKLRTAMQSYAEDAPRPDEVFLRARARRARHRFVGGLAVAVFVVGAASVAAVSGATRGDRALVASGKSATTGAGETSLALPQSGWPDNVDVALQARYDGFLRVSSAGCAYGQSAAIPERLTALLWPAGWRLDVRADGSAEVVDEDGRPRLQTGDYFEVDGGGDPSASADLSGCPAGAARFSMHGEPREAAPPVP